MKSDTGPDVGKFIRIGNIMRVVTGRPSGAIEYDVMEMRKHGAGKDAQISWRKVEERICCLAMWKHYERL